MKISKLAQREARQLFRSCFVSGRLDERRVRLAMALLLEKKPRGFIEIMSRMYRLVKLELDQHTGRVECASPLTADLQTLIAGQLKSLYGDGLDLTFAQNPALIGGLRIQVGSNLYDGSVKARLEQLEQSF